MSYAHEHEAWKPDTLVIWTSARSDWEVIKAYTTRPQRAGKAARMQVDHIVRRRTTKIIQDLMSR